jgi:hypothetical protein
LLTSNRPDANALGEGVVLEAKLKIRRVWKPKQFLSLALVGALLAFAAMTMLSGAGSTLMTSTAEAQPAG